MALAVGSTLRDELERASGDLHAARAEQVVRNGKLMLLLEQHDRYADALRDLATALTMDQYSRLRRETLWALDHASRPATPPLPPGSPGQPSTTG